MLFVSISPRKTTLSARSLSALSVVKEGVHVRTNVIISNIHTIIYCCFKHTHNDLYCVVSNIHPQKGFRCGKNDGIEFMVGRTHTAM